MTTTPALTESQARALAMIQARDDHASALGNVFNPSSNTIPHRTAATLERLGLVRIQHGADYRFAHLVQQPEQPAEQPQARPCQGPGCKGTIARDARSIAKYCSGRCRMAASRGGRTSRPIPARTVAALAVLAATAPDSVKSTALGEALGISPQAARNVLRRMEDRGLVTTGEATDAAKPDSERRRYYVSHYTLTDAGREMARTELDTTPTAPE